MALAIDVMRWGLQRDLRKIHQDFRQATPRSTGARAAARARLTAFSVGVSSCRGLRVMRVVSQGRLLLGRYAKCLDGRQEVANSKIDGLLREYE